MDRSWIVLRNRLDKRYQDGLRNFLAFACDNIPDGTSTILCPCQDCRNTTSLDINAVKHHLFRYGFDLSYQRWSFHGESLCETHTSRLDSSSTEVVENDSEGEDDMIEMLNDLGGENVGTYISSVEPNVEHIHSQGFQRNEDDVNYENMFNQAFEQLYLNCAKYSTLNFIIKLMHIKVLNGWSNKSFDMLLQLLKDAFPIPNNIPNSYYESKKMLKELGLVYEKIHACKHDCVLFWKENQDIDACPVCHESRYRSSEDKQKKIPQKVLRYFPVIPRLERLYMSRYTASDMKWHKTKRVVGEGILRHPADGEAWQDFDVMYPDFAQEMRNVRLGLATDGFNPFGNMSNAYSMWPVILIPYNLPPWKMMKTPYMMMSLLIPGPKAPGKEIDVYLQPLVDDLKQLWSGVEAYDVSMKEIFTLRAAIMWTINDFPALGTLSGWSTKGYKACPVCNEDSLSLRLRSKIGYIGHRRFLPIDHPWRRSKNYDGKYELRQPPREFTGEDILFQLNRFGDVIFGKNTLVCGKRKRSIEDLNWVKRSILFELEYWSKLKLRHNLDVMHIEKNVCEALVGTLMNVEGKSKDTWKARMDLKDMGIRPELHLQSKGEKYYKPHAEYTFTVEERKDFCRFLKSVKLPDGYAANISRFVNVNDGRIYGLKSHDCHVLLQRILPVGIRKYLKKDVCNALTELCKFFEQITAKTLHVKDLEKLEEGVVLILCKLERIFPPAFFDIMVNLTVHLPREARRAGPVASRWMYPIERYLRTLKMYVRNKAHPEGSIAEGYIINEALTFSSMYFRGMETRFTRPERNDDDRNVVKVNKLSVFSQHVRPIGGGRIGTLRNELLWKANWYVLNNCEELQPYLSEHLSTIPHEINQSDLQEREFSKWFQHEMCRRRLLGDPSATDELYALACGPDPRITFYSGCIVNGLRFHTISRDAHRVTQNSGILVPGDDIDYYGVLTNVIQLHYLQNRSIFLFQCDWFDCDKNKKRIIEEPNFISINVARTWYKDDPFIFSTQAIQVFYMDDLKHGANWKVVQKASHRHIWDVVESTDECNNDDDDDEEIDNSSVVQQDSSSTDVRLLIEDDDLDSRLYVRIDVPLEQVDEENIDVFDMEEDFQFEVDDMDDENDSEKSDTELEFISDGDSE